MVTRIIAGLGAAAAAALMLAPAAQADEQSYIDYVRSHGGSIYPDANLISGGWDICAKLQAGQSIESVRQSIWGVVPDAAVYGAPLELCPGAAH